MQARYFALVLGIIYVIVGILGFIPALYTKPPANAPHLDVTWSYGYLFGNFPVNGLHDLLHILIGVSGILCFRSFTASRMYAMTLFIAYGLFTIAGFIPTINTLGGLLPIFGSDTWLHLASALAAAYFGVIGAVDEPQPAPAL